ncbi:MAG: hypothetical protein ACK5MK_00145 [Dysgonomonas sp.]
MSSIKIEYTYASGLRYFIVLTSVVYLILGLYLTITSVISGTYGFLFYASFISTILAMMLFLYFTFWKHKPLIEIDPEAIKSNLSGQNDIPSIPWIDIKEMGIGLGYLQITTEKKIYNIDLSSIKYSDLRNIKSSVIELCESKTIPYHNV